MLTTKHHEENNVTGRSEISTGAVDQNGGVGAPALEPAAESRRRKPRGKRDTAGSETLASPAPTTKNARLVGLLAADRGADITTLSANLGWLPHTTRAALTRLRQAGYDLEATSPPDGGGKRYRIVSAPVAEAGA